MPCECPVDTRSDVADSPVGLYRCRRSGGPPRPCHPLPPAKLVSSTRADRDLRTVVAPPRVPRGREIFFLLAFTTRRQQDGHRPLNYRRMQCRSAPARFSNKSAIYANEEDGEQLRRCDGGSASARVHEGGAFSKSVLDWQPHVGHTAKVSGGGGGGGSVTDNRPSGGRQRVAEFRVRQNGISRYLSLVLSLNSSSPSFTPSKYTRDDLYRIIIAAAGTDTDPAHPFRRRTRS